MAAHPPTGPLPPDDGSGVFRRMGSPSGKHSPPPPDDLAADEPTDLVELTDDESLPIGDLPTAAPLRTDADLAIDEALFADEPLTEPLRAPELSEQPTDPEPIAPHAVGDSAVLLPGHDVVPAHPGSGWFDPPAPPSTSKFEDAAQLFADLRADAPESTTEWVPDRGQVTGRVSESDLFRAFDEAEAAGTDVGHPTAPAAPPADNSDVFSVIPSGPASGSGPLMGGSGVDLADPRTAARANDPDLDSVSSIFAKGASDPPSRGNSDELPLIGTDDDLQLAEPAAGGSSIFERAVLHTPADSATPIAEEADAEAVGFNLPEFRDDPGQLSQASGRIDLSTPFDDPLAAAATPAAADDTTPNSVPTKAARTATPKPGPVADLADEPRRAKAKSSVAKGSPAAAAGSDGEDGEDGEDEEPAGFGRSAGFGKFAGGAAFGLLVSGVTFAALYLGGALPNARKEATAGAPAAAAKSPFADPDVQAKLKELEDAKTERAAAVKEKDDLAAQLLTEKTAADTARTAATKAADALKLNQAELTQAKTDAEKARVDVAAVKTDLAAAIVKANDAKKEADNFKEVLDDAKKTAAEAKKQATDLQKAVTDAEAKVADAAAKQKTAEDKLAGLVKEFRDAKILAAGDDLTKLPAAVKQLAATATSADSKKAADALIAAQKDLDATKAVAKKAADDLAESVKAKAAVERQLATLKADADRRVADAQKGVDDKVKAAVAAATQESKKQLDTLTAAAKKAQDELADAKATATAAAAAAAKKAIDDAVARATAAEAARAAAEKTYEQKLADQAALFAARLADAKAGAVVPVTSAETAALEKAAKGYADAVPLFLAGRYADAEPLFQTAAANGADARHWYFLGLTQYQLGRRTDAAAAFKKGAELEARGKPGPKAVGESLERVQPYLRRLLAEYRP